MHKPVGWVCVCVCVCVYKTVGWGEGAQNSRVGEGVQTSRVGEGVQTSRVGEGVQNSRVREGVQNSRVGGRTYKTVGWGEGVQNSRVGVQNRLFLPQNRCTNYLILIQNS